MARDTFNQFGVTAHEDRVRIIRPIPRDMSTDDAINLAAWLIVAVEMATAKVTDAVPEIEVFRLITAIRAT